MAVGEETVWTIINRNEYNITGPEMVLAVQEGMHYFDLYHGVELTPGTPGGSGCADIFSRSQRIRRGARHQIAAQENRASLLATMKKLTATPLSSLSDRANHSAATTGRGRFDETSVGDTSRNGENHRG